MYLSRIALTIMSVVILFSGTKMQYLVYASFIANTYMNPEESPSHGPKISMGACLVQIPLFCACIFISFIVTSSLFVEALLTLGYVMLDMHSHYRKIENISESSQCASHGKMASCLNIM